MDVRGSVYGSLVELFPQVDSRILKAVAFEHSNDVNGAVEFILCEVLQSISGKSDECHTIHDTKVTKKDDNGSHVANAGQPKQCNLNDEAANGEMLACGSAISHQSDSMKSSSSRTSVGNITDFGRLETSNSTISDAPVGFTSPFPGVLAKDIIDVEMLETDIGSCSVMILEECKAMIDLEKLEIDNGNSSVMILEDRKANVDVERIDTDNGSSSLMIIGERPAIVDVERIDSDNCSSSLMILGEHPAFVNAGRLETENHCSSVMIVEEHSEVIENGSLVKDLNTSQGESEEQRSRCSISTADSVASVSLESGKWSISTPDSAASVGLESAKLSSSVNQRSTHVEGYGGESSKDVNGASDGTEGYSVHNLANNTELASLELNLPITQLTRSTHSVNVGSLEDCVTDAKSNKKILVSAVESVVNMMKEVEILEAKAKQAKEEASSTGQDILAKAEELKKMLQHAQQANDMHAGEIYGEKAILSTEARELQSRLLNLSDERDKSFSVIEEIQETLEARLAAAQEEIAVAEQEKNKKEASAHRALKEQEELMEFIVQESKRLQQEAEENSKLREFLVDRGRAVDTIQGEFAVIFEDVMLLKRRVDEHAPLKGSLLTTTYSSSSSASSLSHRSIASASSLSHRSMASADGLLPSEQVENGEKVSRNPVEDEDLEQLILVSIKEATDIRDNRKSASDDDWEFLKAEACPF